MKHTEDGPCRCPHCKRYRPRNAFMRALADIRATWAQLSAGDVWDAVALVVIVTGVLYLARCAAIHS